MYMNDDRPTVPIGLGYALAENSKALRVFSDMSREHQKKVIESSRAMVTKADMRRFVEELNANK